MVRSDGPMNYLYLALLIATAAYAGWRGGAPERIGIAIVAVNAVLSFLAVSAPGSRFRGVETGVLVVDILAFAAFALLAMRAHRFWPIWVSALLGLGVVGHLAMSLHPQVIPWAYAVVLSVWSYPILLLIVAGTWNHRRRLTRSGVDPSWTRFSAPPGPPAPPPGLTP